MSWVWIVLAPVLGGLLYGMERVVRARMQRRQGPPVLQPFYDMFKLMDKRTLIIHAPHALLAVGHFLILWSVVAALFLGWNLLYIVFMHLAALMVLVLAGYSVRSVYSHVGANRELLALAAYEPVLILVAAGFYLHTGSFDVSVIMASSPGLGSMWPLLAALLVIAPLKLKKSPFDVVEAHQEIVGGVEIEYSGLFYEFLYMARFLEYLFVYGLIVLFGGAVWWLGALLAVGAFLLINLADNATARVKTAQAVRIAYTLALGLAMVNLVWMVLYV